MWSPSGLRPELLEPCWSFISCSSALIAAYCMVMVGTSCSITDLSLVASDTMLLMSPLKDSMKLSAGISTGGVTWMRLLFFAGLKASPFCAIPWMYADALVEPKESTVGL